MGKIKDITNLKFNKLTAIRLDHSKNNIKYWLFKCDCGNEKVIERGHVIKGDIKSCGCIGKNFKPLHNMAKTSFYNKYSSVKARCNNSNTINYINYGARGIKFLWNSFESFKNDMYESYIQHLAIYGARNTTLDRIDNNGNYEFYNCKWSTMKEQAQNRRKRSCYKLASNDL